MEAADEEASEGPAGGTVSAPGRKSEGVVRSTTRLHGPGPGPCPLPPVSSLPRRPPSPLRPAKRQVSTGKRRRPSFVV